MSAHTDPPDKSTIRSILDAHKKQIKIGLAMCAHCSLCAESCFLYMSHEGEPQYMPSYKFLHSVGELYRKKGDVSPARLETMRDLVFDNCVLCTRCYCPMGIDIPALITIGRKICRSQGLFRTYDK